MFAEFTNWLIELVRTHGISAVILGVIIETIIVPIPSPLILMAAGFILITETTLLGALFHALMIALVAGLAQTIGSYLIYWIAYWGGKPIIDKYEKFLGVSWSEILSFKKKFEKRKKEELSLFALRALPIMPLSVISGMAGAIKMDFKRFSIFTFLGTIPRNMFLAVLGWYLKDTYEKMALYIDKAETVMTVLIVFLVIAYIVAKKTGMIDKIREKIFS
ncbi:MAG: VTT domain-containing protein [archaeon]